MTLQRRNAATLIPPGEHLLEELASRNWSVLDCATRARQDPDDRAHVADDLQAFIDNKDPSVRLDPYLALDIAVALGTSADVWLNLDKNWRRQAAAKKSEATKRTPIHEPTCVSVQSYAYLADLILAVEQAVGQMSPGEVGVWYAEKLERAAQMIRENQ
jgi:plasmid maintenance system antidote protein VapI